MRGKARVLVPAASDNQPDNQDIEVCTSDTDKEERVRRSMREFCWLCFAWCGVRKDGLQ